MTWSTLSTGSENGAAVDRLVSEPNFHSTKLILSNLFQIAQSTMLSIQLLIFFKVTSTEQFQEF